MQDVPLQAAQIATGAAQAQQRLRPERRDLDHIPCQPARADTTADRETLAHSDTAGSRRRRNVAAQG